MSVMEGLDHAEAASRPTGAWSAIDTLIHVTSWQENALAIAREQSSPGARTLDPSRGAARTLGIDVDLFNAESLASHREWSHDEAVRWSREVTSALLKALAALPDQRLFGGRARHGARMWYWRPAVVHSREHRRELQRRLRRDD
jgi:hypothetical protein